MKKLLLLTGLLLYTSLLFAQNTDAGNNQKTIGAQKNTQDNGIQPSNDIVKNIAASKELSMFSTFIKNANLTETFQSKGPITVFAPANKAFNELPTGQLDSLGKPAHIWELTNILTYHVIAGSLKARDIEKQINSHRGLATFTTLSGDKLTAKIDSNRNIVLIDGSGGQSIISRFDMEQSNGIVHVITKVLLPKPKVI